jgi:DNA-binding transcriptional LysR family regulator
MHSSTQARYFYDLVVRMIPIQHANVVHTVSQILTMVSLVAAKRGVAFVPHSATLLGVQGVEFLPLESSVNDPVELHAIWNRNITNPALTLALRSLEFQEN